MNLVNYVYCCTYRFALKTPLRSDALAWSVVFIAYIWIVHALTIYFLWTLVTGRDMLRSPQLKTMVGAVVILLIAASFWHYVMKGNAARVVRSFEKHGSDPTYVWAGAIMFFETVLLPLALICLLIVWSKMRG